MKFSSLDEADLVFMALELGRYRPGMRPASKLRLSADTAEESRAAATRGLPSRLEHPGSPLRTVGCSSTMILPDPHMAYYNLTTEVGK